MKTSNKILLVLVVVVFTIPFVLAATLKSKIVKGEYTVKKYNNVSNGRMHGGYFTAFKVVKVIAPNPELLRVHLKLSDKMEYNYFNYGGKDSVLVFTGNDTLYIKYISRPGNADHNGRGFSDNFEVKVNLPLFNNLVVDGAVVIFDSLPAAIGNLNVTLQNNGEIKDGSKDKEDESAIILPAYRLNEDHAQQVSTTHGEDIDTETSGGMFKTVRGDGLKLFVLDIKDQLLSGLLYKL